MLGIGCIRRVAVRVLCFVKIRALDHVVLNVQDVDRSLEFYAGKLGLAVERLGEFREGKVKFPSVRLTAETLIDLFPPAMHAGSAPGVNMNHFCVDVDATLEAIEAELTAANVAIVDRMDDNFGAKGIARSLYVHDPDGNTLELRTYSS